MPARKTRKQPAETAPPPRSPRPRPAETVEAANLDPKKIDPSPFQPRQDFPAEAIDALAETIAAVGLLQPIIVRPKGDRFELIDGERRLRAVRQLKLPTIRAEVQEHTDAQARAIVLVSAIQRADLNAIEEATAFRAAIDAGDAAGPTELARQLGLSQGHVSNRLRLLALPDTAKTAIISQEIPPTHARALLPYKDHPELIAKVLSLLKEEPPEGSTVEDFSRAVDWAVEGETAPMAATQYDRRLGVAKSVFTPTVEQRAELGLVTVPQSSYSKAEVRATNIKLWEKLQAAHVARLAEKANGKPPNAARTKPPTAAEKKAAAAEEKRKTAERAKLFRRRLYEFKIDWLRYLIANHLAEADADTTLRVLTYLAACPEPWIMFSGYSGNMGKREQTLADQLKVCDAAPPKRATGHGRHDELAGLANLANADRAAYVARNFAARCFWADGQADPQVPGHDVETLADFLCLDLAAAWKTNQAGPLSERYWNLHSKDELAAIAAKAGCPVAPTLSKSSIVQSLLANKGLPLPKEILKVKRPR